MTMIQLMENARNCLARLQEIALMPQPLSSTDYIDIMIQEEETIKSPGWKQTVEQLKEPKYQYQLLSQLTKEGQNPLKEHETKYIPTANENVCKDLFTSL